jgi:predicted Zn-dependent protease with MMP-like domain
MLRVMQRDDFEREVDEALESLPDWVVERVDNLHVVVEDWPTRDQDPEGSGLLGIYEGVSLLDRGVDYTGFLPDRIVIFMGPHLRLGLDRVELRSEIRTTVLHELAHHLGIDDARLHELGWD